jgi:hypothetical protein
MSSKVVEVTILRYDGMCVIPVPFDPKVVFGRIRAPVRVTINGYTFRSTICRMGGQTLVPLRKSNRDAAQVQGGECVRVRFDSDTSERTVEPPSDLLRALKKRPRVWQHWQKLSYTNRRESVESVLGAKRLETREKRVAKIVSFVAGRLGTP